MSQKKTLIQGLEPYEANPNPSNVMNNVPNEFYSRSEYSAKKGTIVSGMTEPLSMNSQMNENKEPVRKQVVTGKPVVGFLYSVSRTPLGEFWPLSIGCNSIGKNSDSDIVLSEGTVSNEHAVLVVRQMKNTGKVIAAITDSKSTNGTMINGESIGFNPVECKNGDIITIGNNYELLVVLIDASELGIKPSEEFLVVETESNNVGMDFPSFDSRKTHIINFDEPNFNSQDGPAIMDGTVGFDGSRSGGNHGGTIPV